LVIVFEAFIFGNSLFAWTLLAVFGKIQKQLFIGEILLIKRTSGKKETLVLGNFYLFWTSEQPLSSNTEIVVTAQSICGCPALLL